MFVPLADVCALPARGAVRPQRRMQRQPRGRALRRMQGSFNLPAASCRSILTEPCFWLRVAAWLSSLFLRHCLRQVPDTGHGRLRRPLLLRLPFNRTLSWNCTGDWIEFRDCGAVARRPGRNLLFRVVSAPFACLLLAQCTLIADAGNKSRSSAIPNTGLVSGFRLSFIRSHCVLSIVRTKRRFSAEPLP